MNRRPGYHVQRILAACLHDAGAEPWIDSEVADLAAHHGLASVLIWAVRSGRCRHGLSERGLARLRRASARELALVMSAQRQAMLVIARLHEQGIAVIALKGLVSNPIVYEPRGWCRLPGDIDLLVPDSAALQARRIIGEGPFAFDDGEAPGFYRHHHHLRPFRPRSDPSLCVELHRRISGVTTGGVQIDHAGCWARAVPFPELSPFALRLDDVDHCLATAIHLDRDDAYSGRARQMVDLALWTERCARRRTELWERAAEWNAVSTLARALHVLDLFFDRRVPASGPDQRQMLFAQPRRALWEQMALTMIWEHGENSAVPAWFRGHVLRSLLHRDVWAQIVRDAAGPLLDRFTRAR